MFDVSIAMLDLQCAGTHHDVAKCPVCGGTNSRTVKLSEPIDNGTEYPDMYDTVFDTLCSSCGHKDVHAYGTYESVSP